MPGAGECQTSNTKDFDDEPPEDAPTTVLDEDDIALLKTYGKGPYTAPIKKIEGEIKGLQDKVKRNIPLFKNAPDQQAVH